MLVTPSGKEIDARLVQLEKADLPILFTLSGITVFLQPATRVFVAVSMMALPLFLLSYVVFPTLTTIEARLEQAEKAPLPMLVTLLGIVTDVRPEQPQKALSPMLLTLSGIVTDVSPEQPSKAYSPMLVTLSGILIDVRPRQPWKAAYFTSLTANLILVSAWSILRGSL